MLTELLPVMPGEHDDRRHSGAYIRGREKLILGVDGTARYVDLQRDPGESRSFAASGSDAAKQSAMLWLENSQPREYGWHQLDRTYPKLGFELHHEHRGSAGRTRDARRAVGR